jgi:hypothetical protein
MFCNTVYTLSQNQQEISAISYVVNFNVLLAIVALHNSVFSCASSKWHGTVMCIVNNVLLLNFLWQRRDH